MKIGLVIERMDPSRGGREASTAEVAAALAERGHQVEVLCQSGSWQAEGVAVVPLRTGGVLPARRLRRFAGAVEAAANQRRYDILHATLPVPAANVYQPRGGTIPGQQSARFRRHSLPGRAGVVLTRRLNRRRRLMADFERGLVGNESVMCLAVSELIAREFEQHYGRTKRVRVIYNAVGLPESSGEKPEYLRQRLRYKLGVGSEDPVFITVAKNFELKGVAECIVAFAKWYHGHDGEVNGRLLVVGRDKPEGYERYAGLRDVGRQVAFMAPTRQMLDWYAAAD
ncbi:MAG: glycosyltransferase, partial [Planctomycetota bacterium]